MYVIFDKEDDKYSFGDTLDEAIDEWFSCYEEYPDYQTVTVVQGTEKKFKIDLVDAKAPPKPVTKPAVKKTATKSK